MKRWCHFIVICFYVTVVAGNAGSSCTTPNGEQGSCISLLKCPALLDKSEETQEKFSCGGIKVCCVTKEKKVEIKKKEPPTEEQKRKKIIDALTSKRFCGLQHTDDYVYNYTVTSVDEFPWIAYIPLTDYLPGLHLLQRGKSCVGVLLNKRYIMTDIHCTGSNVILGLHRTDEDISCIETPYVTAPEDCTNPLVVQSIDKFYPLPNNSKMVLARFRRPLRQYTENIRPICLPIDVDNPPPQENDTVVVSGWGLDEYEDARTTKIKKRIKHRLMKKEECQYGNDIPNAVCGMAPLNGTEFVCPGDNGGPMMYRYPRNKKRQNWILWGIVSERASCSERQPVSAEGFPPDTLNWILNQMGPEDDKNP